jgi:hypothetical protein
MFFNHVELGIDIPDLECRDSNHGRYYKIPNGEEYPSVTTILGYESDDSWLDAWRERIGYDEAEKRTKRAQDRGEKVHQMLERYLNNEPKENIILGENPDYVRLFNQMRMHLSKVSNIRAMEKALWSDTIKTAGRVDLICDFDGVPSIVDYKTKTWFDTFKNVDSHFEQCAAYSILWTERTGELIDNGVLIIGSENGHSPFLYIDKLYRHVDKFCRKVENYYEEYLT